MTKYYNALEKESKKYMIRNFEVKRHRRYIASKKWKTISSYHSLKEIPEDAIEYRQKYNKLISPILRLLKLNSNRKWCLVKKLIYKEMDLAKSNISDVDILISKFVITDVIFINEQPYVLRGSNCFKIIKTGNIFYIDKNGILREPKENKMSLELNKIKSEKENEWYLLKKDDNSWYRVIIKDANKKNTHPIKSWVRDYFQNYELKNKSVSVSSLSKKEKRKLLNF